jgi:Putative 2OG-Fe(II) oxygenase
MTEAKTEKQAAMQLLFPLAVYVGEPLRGPEHSQLILSTLGDHGFDPRVEGVLTGEYLGKTGIHKDPRFDLFFADVTAHARQYADGLGIRQDLFDFYVTKSWLTIVDSNDAKVPPHSHSQADISFVYYAEAPLHTDPLWFYDQDPANSLFPGVLDLAPTPERCLIKELNPLNSRSYYIDIEPGRLVMFPGRARHGTDTHPLNELNEHKGRRISLAGDITMCLKDPHVSFESGRMAITHWRRFG